MSSKPKKTKVYLVDRCAAKERYAHCRKYKLQRYSIPHFKGKKHDKEGTLKRMAGNKAANAALTPEELSQKRIKARSLVNDWNKAFLAVRAAKMPGVLIGKQK